MPKKVMIIEDFVDDYYRVANILDDYDIDYYPQSADVTRFSDILSSNAFDPNETDLKEIRDKIKEFAPDFILLDIGLKSNQSADDESGLLLEQELLKKEFPNIPVYKITTKYAQVEVKDRIYKKAEWGLRTELFHKFLEENKIKERSHPKTTKQKKQTGSKNNEKEKTREEKLKERTKDPESLETFRSKVLYRFRPWAQFITDTVIRYLFYLLMLGLAILGVAKIGYTIFTHDFDLLETAETTFIAFLPMLVVFGFFVFYIQSLEPYLMGASVSSVAINIEKTSELIIFTKKLFVSSLISYLFTQLIGILFLEVPANEKVSINWFQIYHYTNTSVVQLYATTGVILILIVYYCILNNHKTNSSAPREIKNH